MDNREKQRQGVLRYLIVLPLLSAIMFWGWSKYEQHGHELLYKRAQDEVRLELVEVMEGLENSLSSRLFVLLGLESYVYARGGLSDEEFYPLAENLWNYAGSGLRSLQLTENTTIRHVYPLKGNESVVGLDLLTIKGQAETVRQTIAGNELVIAGPYNLVQGGHGLIARKPIYLSDRDGGNYWGLATVIIEWDDLLQESGLSNINGLDLTLRKINSDGTTGEFFHGSEAKYLNAVTLPVTLPNAEWELSGRPVTGWPTKADTMAKERMVFYLLFALFLTGATFALRYPALLERRIREATCELQSSQALLELRVEERTQALSESESQIRRLFDTLPFSLIVTTVEDGEVLYANKSAITLFEESDEWHGVKAPDYYVDPKARTRFVETIRRDGFISNFEVELYNAQKKRFWCLASAIRSEYNGRDALLVSHTDISERRAIEQAHIASENNLRTIFDSAPTPMTITRMDGSLVRINQAGMALSGLDEQEISNFRAEDFYCDPEDRNRIMRLVELDGEVTDFELCLHNTSGERFTFLISSTFINYDNEPCMLSSYAEITERKKMELALQQANREAAEAIKAKNEFLATMSHEIRTPLNGALSMIKLLGQTELNEQQRIYLKAIDFSGESLLQILSDVLDLSKLEAGKLELEQADFNLPKLADDMITLLQMQYGQQDVDVSAILDLRIPTWLRGDATRLRQVLFNLMANALKFTERGKVTLQTDFKFERDGNIVIEFSISDTGIGIEESAQSRLFGDFTQADSSVTRRYGGSGLGLAICRRMVDLMGGEIGVESELGKGSRFWFTVALQRGGKPESEDKQGRVSLSHHSLRVLLVEDDAINRIAGSTLLRQQGCEVTVAEDGYEALERFRDGIFDVVLMDVRMPTMDGLETTSKLRQIEPYGADVPVIALTADVTQENIKRCREVGMQEVLSKPVDMERLTEVLATILPTSED